ncbi:MAG: hypothetical protein M0P73_14770 [Syntrophobacterales bacterium]|nr:hypothetical protein [Syntrophobacterales bacterium]
MMRSKNRKKKYSVKKPEKESFEAYRVIVEGFDPLSIFAGSANAAERVARRILGGVDQSYDGPLKVRKEKEPDTRRRRP